MATTMSLIAKQTVGLGGASSVTFSNIPQTFTDLKIVLSGRVDFADTQSNCSVSINGSTSSFSNKLLYGYGSGQGSSSRSDNLNVFLVDGATATSNTFSNCELYFPNYTSSNYKSFSAETATENNGTTALLQMNAELWSNTAAITSITLTSQNGNFVEYSTFYLYGISNSSTQNTTTPLASGGDIISTDGTYWYHTFLYSGTFTPLKNLTCDYLVVAGGGGGGGSVLHGVGGGGGGAGGYRTSVGTSGGGASAQSAISITSDNNYSITVGAGGSGAVSTSTSGSSSSISGSGITTITTTGGGYGGMWTRNAANGGSGGGASWTYSKGTGTANEGYDGGATPGYVNASSGGGGAGGAGGTGSGNTKGSAGAGIASSISGSSVTRGVGGLAGNYTEPGINGSNGTVNYGNGGEGACAGDVSGGPWIGGNGGSGVVIIRYVV